MLITSLITLLFIGAKSNSYGNLVHLTILNKSGYELAIKLTGADEEQDNYYYLKVPKGDRDSPTEVTFTIAPDTYSVQPYYIQLWDPIYGYAADNPSARSMEIKSATRIAFLEPGARARSGGEPGQVKFGVGRGGRRR